MEEEIRKERSYTPGVVLINLAQAIFAQITEAGLPPRDSRRALELAKLMVERASWDG